MQPWGREFEPPQVHQSVTKDLKSLHKQVDIPQHRAPVVGLPFWGYNLHWFCVCTSAFLLSFLMMYLIYSFLVTLGVLLTAPYYVWKRRDELAGRRWRERFGLLPESFQQAERGAILDSRRSRWLTTAGRGNCWSWTARCAPILPASAARLTLLYIWPLRSPVPERALRPVDFQCPETSNSKLV